MANIGDYVTAYQKGTRVNCQGVLVKKNADGSIEVLGEAGSYICISEGVETVPDRNIFRSQTRNHIKKTRLSLGLSTS